MSQRIMASFAMFGSLLIVEHMVPIGALNTVSLHSTLDGQASPSVVGKEEVSPDENMNGGLGLMRRQASIDAQGSLIDEWDDHSPLAAHDSHVPQVRALATQGSEDVKFLTEHVHHAKAMATQGVEAGKFFTEHVHHANAHASVEPTKHDPLPVWAKILCGCLTTLLIMGTFFLIKGRVQNRVPRGVDSRRLEVVLTEALERVDLLKAQLGDQIRDSELLVPEDEDPALTAARREADDLAKRVELRGQEIRNEASRLATQKEQLIASSGRVQEAFADGLQTGRDRLQAFSTDESVDLAAKVQGALNEGTIPAYEAPEWMASHEDGEFLSLPPLLNLTQGVFATQQLQWLRGVCSWVCSMDMVFMILSCVTFGLDWKKDCSDIVVWIWHIGLLSITALDFFVRSLIIRWSDTALDILDESRGMMDKESSHTTGNSLFDKINLLQRGSEGYFEPYFKYHEITDSWAAGFMQFLAFISLAWGAFGCWVSAEHILTDTTSCHAKMALMYMHTYSLFYVLLLTWNLLSVLQWVAGFVASSSILSGRILKFAKSFDDDTMKGMPLAMTLLQSFVLKNSASSLSMSKREVQQDVVQLNKQLQEMDWKLLKMQRSKKRLEEVTAEGLTQEEHLERYAKLTYDTLDQAKPLVGLIAANVRTSDIHDAVMEPTTGTSSSTSAATRKVRAKAKAKNDNEMTMTKSVSFSSRAARANTEEDLAEAAGDDVDSF